MLVEKRLLLPSTEVHRALPINIRNGDEIYFQHEYKKIFDPVHLHQLINVNVSPEGVIFNNFKIHERSLINGSEIPKYSARYLLYNYLKRKKIKLDKSEKYILAFSEWSSGYFHWMCDTLPRLILIKELLPEYTLLLPQAYSEIAFIRETLKLFTIKKILGLHTHAIAALQKPEANTSPSLIPIALQTLNGLQKSSNLSIMTHRL